MSSSREYDYFAGLILSTGIARWELEMLYDSCVQRNCLNKLEKMLEDYKKYFSGITTLMIKRQEISTKLHKVSVMLVSQYDDELMVYFAELLKDLSITTSKLLYALTCLRLLQQTPRPLFYEDVAISGEEMKIMDDEHTLSLQETIKRDAELINKAICSNKMILEYCLAKLPCDILAVALINFLQTVLQEGGDSSLLQGSGTEMAFKIVDNVCNILVCEDKVESSFWAISMTQGGRNGTGDPLSSYPVLVSPYGADNVHPGAMPGYNNLLQYYEVAKSFLNNQLRQIVSGKQSLTVSSGNEVAPYPASNSDSNKEYPNGNSSVDNTAASDLYKTDIPSSLQRAIAKSKVQQSRSAKDSSQNKISSSTTSSALTVDTSDADRLASSAPLVSPPSIVASSSKQPKSQPPTPGNRAYAASPSTTSARQKATVLASSATAPKGSKPQLSSSSSKGNISGTKKILTKVKAARIIQKWVRLVLPIKRLSKYRFAKSIIFELVDVVVIRCYVKKAMKKRWAREIVRCRRLYEMEKAVIIIQKNIRRFIVLRNKLMRCNSDDSEDEDDYLNDCGDDEKKSFNRKRNKTEVNLDGGNLNKFNNAVGVLQKYAKRYFFKKAEEKRYLHILNCAIFIQRVYRGSLAKRQIYDEIIATFKLQRAVYRRIALRKLKADIARFERPIVLNMKKLMHLPSLVYKHDEGVKYVIKVYNNPLLHILAVQDVDTFLGTTKPSIILKSKLDRYELMDDQSKSASSWRDTFQSWRVLNRMSSEIGGMSKAASQFFSSDATGSNVNRKRMNDIDRDMHVDFNNDKVLIPAVHGRTVIKFEFYNGEAKFAQYYWYVFKEIQKENFMFWKCEFCREINDGASRRVNVLNRSSSRNFTAPKLKGGNVQVQSVGLVALQSRSTKGRGHTNVVNDDKQMKIELACSSGLPFRTSTSVCLIKMGLGIIHKDLRRHLTDITGKWSKFHISYIDSNLYIFDSKRSISPRVTIHGDAIIDVYVQTSTPTKSSILKTEDTRNLIIRTAVDELTLRLADKKTRSQWCETFTNVFAYRRAQGFHQSASTKFGVQIFRESVEKVTRFQKLFFNDQEKGQAGRYSVKDNKSYLDYVDAYRSSFKKVKQEEEAQRNLKISTRMTAINAVQRAKELLGESHGHGH